LEANIPPRSLPQSSSLAHSLTLLSFPSLVFPLLDPFRIVPSPPSLPLSFFNWDTDIRLPG
jgi:hypothetical protein